MQHTEALQFLLISVVVGKDALCAYTDHSLTPLYPSGVILEIIFSRKPYFSAEVMSSSEAATTIYCLFPLSLFTPNSLQRRAESHSSVYPQYSAWYKEIYLHEQIDCVVFTSYSRCLEQCLSQSRCSVSIYIIIE